MSCCGSALQDCNVQHGKLSRLPYLFLTFLCIIFAIVMSLYGEKKLYSSSLLNKSFSICESSACEGNGSVYRVSFTLFVFYVIHAVIVHFAAAFQWLFFIIKFICVVGFLTMTFFIGGTFFDGYAEFARVVSAFFLVVQIFVLLTWALDMNDWFIAKINTLQDQSVETESTCSLRMYQCLLIFLTLLAYVAVIIAWVFLFKWFFSHFFMLIQ